MATARMIPGARHCAPILLALLATACGRQDEPASVPADVSTAAPGLLPASGQPAPEQLSPEQFDSRYGAIAAAEADIPRETFDPEAIVKRVGKDSDALANWVRTNTTWVPYRGALRGPIGVLMDRMGNSLDRSLLLAELLRIAGHPVRLTQGAISPEAAQSLVEQIPAAPPGAAAQSTNVLSGIAERDIAEYATRFQVDPGWMSRAVETVRTEYAAVTGEMGKRIAFQVPFITEAVGAPELPPDTAASAIAALRDHWWVQLDDGARWIDIDVTLSNQQRQSAQITAAETHPFDRPVGDIALGSNYAHEIVLRVVVEQWKGGQLAEKVALEHAFRPSEVVGKPILFQNIPLRWDLDTGFLSASDPLASFKDSLLEQTEWLPLLDIGGRAVFQSSVLENGDLNTKPGTTQSGPDTGGVADTLGGSESFGGDDDEPPQPETHFTAEWIEYEIRVPGERPDVIRRVVFDMLPGRSGSARTADEPAPNMNRRLGRNLGLMGSVQILPMTSRISREYALSQVAREALRTHKLLLQFEAKANHNDLQGTLDQIRQCPPTSKRLYELGLARFEWSKVRSDVYIDSPNVLTYRRTAVVDERGQLAAVEGFDIVSNSVAVNPRTKKSPFDVRIHQGVADTNAESLLMGRESSGAGSLLGTGTRAASWIAIGRSDSHAALHPDAPPRVRDAINEAVEAGYVVIAPRSAGGVEGSRRWDWWRVDPKNGGTLGFTQEGWGGSDTAENAILIVGVGMAGGASAGALSGMLAYTLCLEISQLAKGRAPSSAAYQARRDACKCVAVDVGTGVGLGVAGGLIGGIGWGVGLFLGIEAMGKVVCGALAA